MPGVCDLGLSESAPGDAGISQFDNSLTSPANMSQSSLPTAFIFRRTINRVMTTSQVSGMKVIAIARLALAQLVVGEMAMSALGSLRAHRNATRRGGRNGMETTLITRDGPTLA